MLHLRHLLLAGLLATPAVARETPPSNDEFADRTLIVLAAPSVSDSYYRDLRTEILAFHVAFAKRILGRDNVVVLGDKRTLRELAKELPEDVLLAAPMRDIWMRDFAPAGPERPVLFRYSAAAQAGRQTDADWVQDGFLKLARRHGLEFRRAPWILDGGNVVDNGADKVVVTERFLADNHLDRPQALAILREQLGAERIAILPADPEDALDHADGMVAFLGADVVALTRYGGHFQQTLRKELRTAFPGIRIVEIAADFDAPAWDADFGSANGIYVNAVVTARHAYVPVYGLDTDARALAKIRAATDREVVPIDARHVGQMGGSVRCLCASFKGENARRLILAARKR